MKSALDVHGELLAAGVPHEMVRLRTPAVSADDLPRGLDVDPDVCVAVRCYVATDESGSEQFVAVLVRSGDLPDPGSLLTALDAAAVRAATADEVNAATDFSAPLVAPIALGPRVQLLADAALGATDVLYAPTGESGVALGIRTRDLLVAAGARVTTLTARRAAPEEQPGWDRAGGVGQAGAQVIDLGPARRGREQPHRTGTTRP